MRNVVSKSSVARNLVATAALLFGFASVAEARAVHATSGMPINGANTTYSALNGVTNYGAGSIIWVLPLTFDNSSAGAKTIGITGKASSTGSLSCQAIVMDSNGALWTSSSSLSWPTTGVFTRQTLSVSSLPAIAYVTLVCTLSGSSTSVLLGADYAP